MVTVDNVYIFKKEILHKYCFELNIFCASAVLLLLYNRFLLSLKILYLSTRLYLKISRFFSVSIHFNFIQLYEGLYHATFLLACYHGRVPFIFELY